MSYMFLTGVLLLSQAYGACHSKQSITGNINSKNTRKGSRAESTTIGPRILPSTSFYVDANLLLAYEAATKMIRGKGNGLTPEQQKLENYTVYATTSTSGYDVYFLPKHQPGTPPHLGYEYPNGLTSHVILDKHFKIITTITEGPP